jgi:outer membrane protein TolC
MNPIRNPFTRSFLFAVCLLLNQQMFGQTQDSTVRLSAKEAIDFALEHHKDVKNATLDARISSAQVNEIIGIGLPQVNGSFDVKDFFEIPS